MKYSFISTSQGGRLETFMAFVLSLKNETLRNGSYEIIFIDQSNGDYDDFLSDEKINSNIKVIKADIIPLSKARNVALKHAVGEYVFFSDDDADYSKYDFTLLEFLLEQYDLISFPLFISPDGARFYGDRPFPRVEKILNVLDIFLICLSLSVVIKRSLILDAGLFDEDFGAGAIYGGSEETDLILKIYQQGSKVFYTPRLLVMHPDEYVDISYDKKCIKFYKYSLGYSKICKRYSLSLRGVPLIELSRVVIRTTIALIVRKEKKFYWYRLKGFIIGFLS